MNANDIHWLYDDEENYPGRLSAMVPPGDTGHAIDGHYVHVHAYRVDTEDGMPGGEQVAWQTCFRREVRALQTICGDGALEALEIDGFPGKWVVVAFSYGC